MIRSPDASALLRLYARHRERQLAARDPVKTQGQVLAKLVRSAADTRFGREHGFSRLHKVADFQAAVPLRRYEDFWRDYGAAHYPVWENLAWPGRIPYFALTSGTTTGRNKYIPVSRAMVKSNVRAALDTLARHVIDQPEARPFSGRIVLLGGSTALTQEAPGVLSGDLSGIAARETPRWARGWSWPSTEIALISDWDEKLTKVARSMHGIRVSGLTGTPNWLLILLDRLAELGGDPAGTVLPDLQLLVHGGIAWAPYRDAFRRRIPGIDRLSREVYPASEGFIASADRGPGQGLRLNIDNGLFFEFVPAAELDRPNPTRHWMKTAEIGVEYALVLSTCAGLWGHVVGDTVRFVDLDPPRIVITGRTGWMLSAFGEHLIVEEVDTAMSRATREAGVMVEEFAVMSLFPSPPKKVGGHLYIVEPAAGAGDGEAGAPDRLAGALDEALIALNEDYDRHRAGGIGLDAPTVRFVPPGTFAGWMAARGKAGGQNKVPRIVMDRALARHLVDFAGLADDLPGEV